MRPIPVYVFVATIKAVGTGQTRLTAQFFHRANIVIFRFDFYPPFWIYYCKQMTKFFMPQGYADFSCLELFLRYLFRSSIETVYCSK